MTVQIGGKLDKRIDVFTCLEVSINGLLLKEINKKFTMKKRYLIVCLVFQVLAIRATAQKIGIGTGTPLSTLEIKGTFGFTSVTNSTIGSATNQVLPTVLDNTATVWLFNGISTVTNFNFSVTLPTASAVKGRMYIIINETTGTALVGSSFTISAFTDLTGTNVTTIADNNSIQIISDGNSWLQIL